MEKYLEPDAINYGANCINKDSCLEDLKRSYTTPGHPIAFSGLNAVHKYYRPHLSIPDIENVLASVESYTLHREFHSGQRNPSYSHFKRYQWQCDLVDIQQLSKDNDNVRYLFTAIDTFTRFAFVRPLVDKTGAKVVREFKSMLEESVTPPLILILDRGLEFYNKSFIDFCNSNNIKMFSPDSSIHAAYIERFNRTFQGILYKYMTENETRRYIDVLQELVATYNNKYHRMIGTTPFIAENNENSHSEIRRKMSLYYNTIKPKKAKYKIGDVVRIAKLKGKFDRGYNERSSTEMFKIQDIVNKFKIPMYILSNYSGNETIKGKFYEFELAKVVGEVFRVEKVIKKRKYRGKQQLFVKWKGFDDSHNSWVDSNQVTNVF